MLGRLPTWLVVSVVVIVLLAAATFVFVTAFFAHIAGFL